MASLPIRPSLPGTAIAILYAGVTDSRPDLPPAQQVRLFLAVMRLVKNGPGLCHVCKGKGFFRRGGNAYICPF